MSMNNNKEKSKISIIVPIYNVDKYLNKCLDSIINQTYDNLEIILVDDGSTDKCPLICDEYKNIDSRIIVIHKDNKGLSSARNAGLDIATGDLIGFVDSDDFLELDMYEILKSNMDKYLSDIAICDFKKVDKKTKVHSFSKNEFSITGKDKFLYIHNEYSSVAVVAWNKLYKRELFDNIRYKEGKLYEDRFIIYELLEKAKSISYILKPLYNYVYREDSIMNTISLKLFDWVDAFNNNIEFDIHKDYDDIAYFDKKRKCSILISTITKLKAMKLLNKNNYKDYKYYYDDLSKTIREIKWKDCSRALKSYKIFNYLYICFRTLEIRFIYMIKSYKKKNKIESIYE